MTQRNRPAVFLASMGTGPNLQAFGVEEKITFASRRKKLWTTKTM